MKNIFVISVLFVVGATGLWLSFTTEDPASSKAVATSAPLGMAPSEADASTVTDASTKPGTTVAVKQPAREDGHSGIDPPAPAAFDEQPIDERIAELQAAAANGDSHAACRAAAELSRCRAMKRWSQNRESFYIDRLADSDMDAVELREASEHLSRLIQRMDRHKTECARVDADSMHSILLYDYQSALAGNVTSMARFASAQDAGGTDIVANPMVYQLYRDNAFEMFQRSFEAGHPLAVTAWTYALNSNGFSFLGGALPEEWRTPEVANALQLRLISDPDSTESASGEVTDAQRQADALFHRYFASSPWLDEFRLRLFPKDGDPQNQSLESRFSLERYAVNDDYCDASPP